ncbi:hypothetical protein SGRIM128S_03001 [Streptomyces griseomycini]
MSAPVTQKPSGTRYARHNRRPGTPAGPSSTASAVTSTRAAPGQGGNEIASTVRPSPSTALSTG